MGHPRHQILSYAWMQCNNELNAMMVEDLTIFPTNLKNGRINILSQNRNEGKHNLFLHESEI